MSVKRGGWIKLYWKTKDSLMASSAVSLGLWTHILLSVAIRPTLLRNGDRLEVGEALLCTKDLAKWAGVSDRTIRRYIAEMENDGAIEVLKRDRNGTRIRVCNWRLYQDSASDAVREVTSMNNESTTKVQRNGAQTESPKSPERPKIPKSPSPPTPPGEQGGWEGLIEELTTLRVTQARTAAAAAQAAGCEPSDFRPHLAHWKANRELWASPLGVLCRRLEYLRPDQPASEGWPAFDSVKERERRRQVDQQREAERRQRAVARLGRLVGSEDHGYLVNQAKRRIRRDQRDENDNRVVELYMLDYLVRHPNFGETVTTT